ncbi:hypothetical protein [Luteolibacter marinus]|uniref:hypothetical protein n=1 Tax=Luteolibacter marinus TaxID=2776705 RepID=UPI001865FDCF|nr:hypothetical protein [Luteolibacter marinus]
MKQTLKSILILALGGSTAGATTVVADFNDLVPGDLNGQFGGTGFGTDAWTNNSAGTVEPFIDVVAGDLTAPAATNYALVQSGTPQSARNTDGTTSLQTRVLDTPLTGGTIWFSFLLNQASASPNSTSGSRGGICFNQATTGGDPGNPRVMALGSQLTAWLTGNSQITINNALTANTTALILGRIQVSDPGNETLSLWVNPDVNALGAPAGTFAGGDWVGAGGITSVSVQSYGAGNGGIVDAVRISDDPDAYTQVTGSTIPDPVLAVDPGSTAADYAFGAAYPGGTTRTVTFRNEGPNNSLTVQNVTLSDDAGGVFTIDNVMPAVGSTLAPGETISIRLLATSATGGNFTGELSIDTNHDTQDKLLPVTAAVFAPGARVNPNPTFDGGLAGWTTAAAVTPGIAPASARMARVRGKGDKGLPLDETDSLGQAAGIPDGAADWELSCFFTPIRSADFESYTGSAPDGSFGDRSFQLAIFEGNHAPAVSLGDPEAISALIQLAYFPDGNGSDPEGFYGFDGATWVHLAGLPAIAGSIDTNEDGRLEAGTDTVNAYRLNVRGSGFGSGSASYSVTLSGGELAAPVTQSSLTGSAGSLITSAGPGSFTFTSSDVSLTSNPDSGFCTPFWVDDVAFHATALPEPSMTILGNLVIEGFNEATPSGTLVVRNDGFSQDLNLTAATFGSPALSLASPALPLAVTPGSTATLEVQLASATIAPDTALLSTMSLASDDPSQPSTLVPLTASSTTPANLIPNWNFETPGTDNIGNTDNFAFWSEFELRTRNVPGILPGSATAVYLDATGATTFTRQTLANPPGDFDFQCGFAVRATANRAFNLLLAGSGGAQINLRYEGNVWSAFNGSGWQTLIDQTAAPLTASVDSNFDGDFLDAGESLTAYRLHLTGSGWGTATPTYQIEILDAAGAPVAAGAGPFSHFQNGPPTQSGLATITFTNQSGNCPGFWVDDVLLGAVSVPADLRVTGFTVNHATGEVSITFTSEAGVSYSITASDDLGLLDDFTEVATASGNAGTTTATFTDPVAVGKATRFYRVETP